MKLERKFSFADARDVLSRFNQIEKNRNKYEKRSKKYQKNIVQASQEYLKNESIEVLEGIPVEELNRGKKGIRVKLLRTHGYNSYADVYYASVYSLSKIKGISEEKVHLVKNIVSGTLEATKDEIKLKLSVDHKTSETTEIILNTLKLKTNNNQCIEFDKIYEENIQKREEALDNLKAAKGFFRWLFTSSDGKNAAIESYDYLQNVLSNGFEENIDKIENDYQYLHDSISDTYAWNEFTKNPISFNTLLEEIIPELIGGSNDVYGLPEDIVEEIQTEDYSLGGLHCNLRRYQRFGVNYILHQRKVLLGDEMGLGKTIQAIATMVALRNQGETHFIVVCPASVLINWCREIEKFCDIQAIKVHGSTRTSGMKDWINSGGIAVTTYETTSVFELPKSLKCGLVVVDEAHYIKNPDAKRTINTKRLCEHADRLLFMTGTALENNIDEMIRLITILQPDIAKKINNMKMMPFAPLFRETIAPVYYRRKREDVLSELPELLENEEWCEMGYEEQCKYYDSLSKGGHNHHEIRQVSWRVDDLHDSSKACRMLEIIQEAKEEGRKVIVFSFYLDTIRKISKLLGNQCTEIINGSVSPKHRQEIIDEFESAPAGSVLLSQIMAGGTGLNIQSASVVIICEPQIKPSIESQAISRAYRMGQSRNVLVYRLLCNDTIDERITDILTRKTNVFNAFADQSAAVNNIEIDSTSLTNMIDEERKRIMNLS